VYRQPPAREALARAAALIRDAARPLIVAGGGVIYSEATDALKALVNATGIPVGETMAGRGALVSDHPLSLGAIGATGGAAANRLARDADVVIGVGTRWSDFTTASHSAFQDPGVRFVNVNVAAFDAGKQSGLPVVADARVALEQLREALQGWRVDPDWERRAASEAALWDQEVDRVTSLDGDNPSSPTQSQIIKEINEAAGETGVVVCAAGSAPGDLHKLWRAHDPAGKSYHVEYGYSCMGYEIPGGMGVKLAAPEREVYVLVGDGSYLMLPGELVTAVAQRVPIVIVLVDNHGYASIGALSRSIGSSGFGTLYRFSDNGSVPLDPASTDVLPLDLAANAESLGARVVRARTVADLREALAGARGADGPVVVHIEADRYKGVPSYESWWDVPVAEVSEEETVREAREAYDKAHEHQRQYLRSTHD
jgi:3D-(3,5/4)-trihydroxycyclohexane-1,2-dione acylhydrolase (decyclizing)